ncbi:MAG: thiamine pyrophosphokinase [Sphingobacteriaceae bacterium]
MSSHHIVREKQEPALLIMSLEHFPAEYLGQLLEWSPTVLVSEQVYEQADSIGIKIDGVVTANANFDAQEHTLLIPAEGEPLEDALKHLVAEGYPAVNIIDDHFALKDYVFFVDLINLVIFNPVKKIFPIKSGFSKWQSAGQKIELMHEVHHLHLEGLKKRHDHEYETEKDGFYSLTFDQPFIFIAEEL